jgi:AcrR family transcriptional regulator
LADTREKILNSALNLFAKNGYHGTSIRAIADSVGIQKSSIYNHFSGKKAIFSELFKKLAPIDMEEEFYKSKILNENEDPVEILHFFGRLIIDEMKDKNKSKWLKIMLREHSHPEVKKRMKERLENNVRIGERFFKKMKDKGEIKSDLNCFLLANEFIGGIVFFRMRYLLFELDSFEELEAETEEHIDFFWKNIKKET